MRILTLLLLAIPVSAIAERVPGLRQPVEILRDRWGVPHIYANNVDDLFFGQGYLTAKDRLFQIDLWRRTGTGRLAEVLGPAALDRDTLARAVRYRGPMEDEWQSYGPETRRIVTAFVNGINAYIRSLGGKRPREFQVAGFDPGLWTPEDCLSRIAGLLMTRNLVNEVRRATQVRELGLESVQRYFPPDPPVRLEIPRGLDLARIESSILQVYQQAISTVHISGDGDGGLMADAWTNLMEQGSNNWVMDGTMTATGKPILANDPHRPILLPSLRKTVHLVAPGWNVIGAGEPALPGIALGHNENIAFGFTIVGIDQCDLYVETLDPKNPDRYQYKGQWKTMEIEKQQVPVRGRSEPAVVELRHTVHGPVLYMDRQANRAYALRWVGTEPGTAGYLAGLALSRARNWQDFTASVGRYKVPSENIVYADTAGNIGWHATGLTPVRKNWSGLLPVPGASGEYEWSGFVPAKDLPHIYNPPAHYVATANHNILPPDYPNVLGYEWALPFRFQRIREMIAAGRKFGIGDFERMQHDVTSVPARRFQALLKGFKPQPGTSASKAVEKVRAWDARMSADSAPAMIYAIWVTRLPLDVFGPKIGPQVDLRMLLRTLEAKPDAKALETSLSETLKILEARLGPDMDRWQWGAVHQIQFRHPLDRPEFNRGPFARNGDGNTVMAASGANFVQSNGASYRQIMDLADWDRSVMTNVPGESGDPSSRHYADLIPAWLSGKYHPMPYTRKAVEAAAEERIALEP